jgi:hypothetical protein
MTSPVVTISGNDVTDYVIQDSLSVSMGLDNRWTADFSIKDDAGSSHFDIGEPVTISYGGSLVFGGIIESIDETLIRWGNAPLISKIECVDWSRIFDRYFVANVYENMTIGDIVADIINVQTQAFVDGITVGTIPTFTVTKAVFSYQRISDCLRDLCQISGLSWSVTPAKVLEMHDRSTYTAPVTIGDSGSSSYSKLSYSRNISQYRNVQWLRAGKNKTSERIEYFRGNSTITNPELRVRTFTLAYPVCSITYIKRGTITGMVDQTVGVKEVDKDNDLTIAGWKQWFYQVDEREITQNSASDETNNPTLTADEILEVKYVGYYPIMIHHVDDAKISVRKAAEGGSGIYESTDIDENIDDWELARDKALRMVEQYGRIPGVLKYSIDYAGIKPGHLQTIALANHGIASTQFMVVDVSIEFPGFSFMRCLIEALDGERVEGWSDYWRRVAASGRKMVIRENEVVMKLTSPEETITLADSLEDSENNGPITIPDCDTDPFTVGFIGVISVGGITVPLTRIGRSKLGVHPNAP